MEHIEYRVKDWDREAMMEIVRPATAMEIINKLNEVIDWINKRPKIAPNTLKEQ